MMIIFLTNVLSVTDSRIDVTQGQHLYTPYFSDMVKSALRVSVSLRLKLHSEPAKSKMSYEDHGILCLTSQPFCRLYAISYS
jgi:hypothetical protein